jgi:hypothetical protein
MMLKRCLTNATHRPRTVIQTGTKAEKGTIEMKGEESAAEVAATNAEPEGVAEAAATRNAKREEAQAEIKNERTTQR